MKKHISLLLIFTLLFTTILSFGGVALAAPSFTVSTDVKELSQDADVEFDYSISGVDIPSDFKIVLKNTGKSVNIGTLSADGSKDDSFTMKVPYDKLGKLTFELYAGDTMVSSSSVTINKKELVTKLGASTSVSQNPADSGSTVKFEFKLENQGETAIENIVVTASGLNNGKPLNNPFALNPGKNQTVKYSHTMSANVTVTPVVSFTVNGNKQTQTLESTELKLSSRDVKTNLTVDNAKPQPGEEVTFTLTLTNNGNVSYTNIKILANGVEQDYPSKLKAGETVSGTFKMTFQASADVSCTISLKDHTGETKSINSNTVSIELPVDPNAISSKLQFAMNVDRPQLTSAGTVNFTGYITNATDYELSNIKVDEATIGNIYSGSTLAAGQKASIQWTADINATTTYNFVLTATDKDGNPYTVNAQPITVTIQAEPQESAGFEEAAEITETPLTLQQGGLGSIGTLGIIAIVLVVLIIGVGVTLFVLWKKGQSPKKATTPAGRKRPTTTSTYSRGGSSKRPTGPKSYRDRNNF